MSDTPSCSHFISARHSWHGQSNQSFEHGSGAARTLRALARLAFRYGEGDWEPPTAIALGERIIGDAYDALGPEDEAVGALRAMLFVSYTQVGRTGDAHALHTRFPTPGDNDEAGC